MNHDLLTSRIFTKSYWGITSFQIFPSLAIWLLNKENPHVLCRWKADRKFRIPTWIWPALTPSGRRESPWHVALRPEKIKDQPTLSVCASRSKQSQYKTCSHAGWKIEYQQGIKGPRPQCQTPPIVGPQKRIRGKRFSTNKNQLWTCMGL